MKRRLLFKKLATVAGIIAAFAVLIAIFCIAFPNKYIIPFVVAAVITVAAVAALIVFSVLYSYPDKALKEKWARYAGLQPEKVDFKAELEQVRKNFASDLSPDKNRVEEIKANGVNRLYDYSVLKNGKIYYAYLVEANTQIFQRKFTNKSLLGVVVYSPDEYFESNPYALKAIAENLFNNRANNVLRNESALFSNIGIKGEREVYMTVVPFYRPHMPFGCMTGSMFPVIANPQNCTSVFAVDDIYWTDALVANFIHGDTNAHDPNADPFAE